MYQIKNLVNLIKISPHSLTMPDTKNTEFQFIEVWFTDQTSKQLEVDIATKTRIDAAKTHLKELFKK